MFYSHEILTSPEHGVATIWLVATLGSRSITRRVNRKAILDVDVPEACRVIVNPQAPMALRLQGNLLYGVSRVYDQQCGYTLLDTQTMHDKMISTLKLIPGGGLDPSVGQTKPSTLVLPYDPSFFPETNLPGLDFDFSLFDIGNQADLTQRSGLWTKSPPGSHSSASHTSVRLDLGSDDLIHNSQFIGMDNELSPSRKRGLFGGPAKDEGPEEEAGILLQPDFEFDETGALVELDVTHLSPRKRRKLSTHGSENQGDEIPLPGNDNVGGDMMDLDLPVRAEQEDLQLPGEEPVPNQEQPAEEEVEPVIHRQRRQRTRVTKNIDPDNTTTLRNSELAQWNNGYIENMAIASKQKQQNKLQTITKKNAVFCVFGQGIGSVGVGLGLQKKPHPLAQFSGEALYDMFFEDHEESSTNNESYRPGGESVTTTPHQARIQGKLPDSVDVEYGRQGPSSVLDEHSSQMPWNITTSARSSRLGRLGSIGDFSAALGSTGLRDPSLHGQASGIGMKGRSRGRLTSASPLSGRGYLDPHERQSSLSVLGIENALDGLDEDLEITRYLEGELATDNEDIGALSRRASAIQHLAGQLDQESLNFFDFIQDHVKMKENSGDSGDKPMLAFSELLPPKQTSRTVATQGLMNVLTLATKGVLTVEQDPYRDAGAEVWGQRYDYGEIFMRM
ncbi:uncharacterized protein N7483_004294 [Penicillium malachiteum]|uniref:uncharacterized protein n=1 Tax=Penicillium malachiteum TaxID=1324776 RepID=UPI002547C00A|nr:uncharacterized protein N7483_004294 [Penicillium malachiteum]KAJ5729786.1 hypothetical protein N7483_004294 [Penicillium malachiteum]